MERSLSILRITRCWRCGRPVASVDRIWLCCRRVLGDVKLSVHEAMIFRRILFSPVRPVRRWDLVAVLWPDPDDEPEYASSSVSKTMFDLRAKLLEIDLVIPNPHTSCNRRGYMLRPLLPDQEPAVRRPVLRRRPIPPAR